MSDDAASAASIPIGNGPGVGEKPVIDRSGHMLDSTAICENRKDRTPSDGIATVRIVSSTATDRTTASPGKRPATSDFSATASALTASRRETRTKPRSP